MASLEPIALIEHDVVLNGWKSSNRLLYQIVNLMLQITPQHKLMIAVQAVDFRRGIDGLIAISRSQLNSDPFNGCLFAFRNKGNTSIKLLIFDGNGFWLAQKGSP